MRLSARFLVVSVVLLCSVPSIRAWAVDLQEHTRLAFDRYAEEATENFLKRVRADAGTSVDGAQSSRARRLRDGAIVARAGGQDGIIGVSDGLVHHWFAASFIDGVTLADALNVSFAYADYHAFYRPILASRLLAHPRRVEQVMGDLGRLGTFLAKEVRARLSSVKSSAPLFDAAAFARDLERLYSDLAAQH